MLLGLEQFLGTVPEAEDLPYIDPFIQSAPTSGALTEDLTDLDDKDTQNSLPEKPDLMSLLRGKQTTSKKKRAKKFADNKEKTVQKTAEVSDTSFDASEFEKNIEKQQVLAELERKMFKSGKSMSAWDLLRPKSETPVVVLPEEEIATPDIAIVPEVVAIPDDLAPMIGAKRVTARDLFSSFAPKRLKNSKGEWTLKVKLKVGPDKLAAVKEFDDPFKTRGTNAPSGNSMLSALMKKKPSQKVTLKLPTDFLREIAKTSNPLYTKSSGNNKGKNANSVFAMMMQSASASLFPKLTPIQKLKELDPPVIERSSFHVIAESESPFVSDYLLGLPLREALPITSTFDDSLETIFPTEERTSIFTTVIGQSIIETQSQLQDVEKTVAERAPLAFKSAAHKRLFTDFIVERKEHDMYRNWPTKFQPPDLQSLLLAKETKRYLEKWISNSFKILKTQSTKTPRNVKIREQQRRQRQRESAMMGFIVDDELDEGEETEEDVFVPLLIVQGSTGSCKSAAIYLAMNALDGYVHEINAGQQRSRRDLYGSLKEFCTTQIIHQTSEDKNFQKGLVLFEDCDVLFEQDKTFWTVVQDVVNFSRRPIVITVNDLGVIPKNILELAEEQDSIISLQNNSAESIGQYLWLCCYSEGYDILVSLQDLVLRDCKVDGGYDLRKALMMCQWLCCRGFVPHNQVRTLQYREPPLPEFDDLESLENMASKLDTLSVSDVLTANSTSFILHEQRTNELLDVYVVDDTLQLKQPTAPHELNIGQYLMNLAQHNHILQPPPAMTYNDYRNDILDFISSRAKKLPKFLLDLQMLRSSTRSRSSSEQLELPPETQGLPDASICYSIPPTAFITELAPWARHWARFQNTVIMMDIQHRERGQDVCVESFLDWRRFHSNTGRTLGTFPNFN